VRSKKSYNVKLMKNRELQMSWLLRQNVKNKVKRLKPLNKWLKTMPLMRQKLITRNKKKRKKNNKKKWNRISIRLEVVVAINLELR